MQVITDGDRSIHSICPAKVESNCSALLEFDLKFSPSFDVLSTFNVNIIRRFLMVGPGFCLTDILQNYSCN